MSTRLDLAKLADALAINRSLVTDDGRAYHMVRIGPEQLAAIIAALRFQARDEAVCD